MARGLTRHTKHKPKYPGEIRAKRTERKPPFPWEEAFLLVPRARGGMVQQPFHAIRWNIGSGAKLRETEKRIPAKPDRCLVQPDQPSFFLQCVELFACLDSRRTESEITGLSLQPIQCIPIYTSKREERISGVKGRTIFFGNLPLHAIRQI